MSKASADFAVTKFNDFYANEAARLRSQADRQDRMAIAAEADGDKWDAASCRAKAAELRRSARRLEVSP